MTDATDDDTDDGTDERRQARRQRWKEAIRASFLSSNPERSERGGAEIDAEIDALQQRVATLEASDAAQNSRLTALEAGETTPPVEPPIEPPIEPPVTGKRYPTKNDPSVGLPAGTSLTNATSNTLSQSGAKVSGKRFSGRVVITASNVELFNCEITSNDWLALEIKASGANVHHCTIKSTATTGNTGINTRDGTRIAYCRITGFENGFNINGNNVVIEWNECWQLTGNNTSHYDVLQADGGTTGLNIRNNYFDCSFGQTSSCMLDNYFGPIRDVTVENNFLGGGGYPAYLDGSFKGSSNATNIKYLNNDMRGGKYGGYFYRDSVGTQYTRTGNKDYLTGASVDNK